MELPSPEWIARRQAAARERANLEAALTVLDAVAGTVTVPSVGEMTFPVFRKHVALRHPGTPPSFIDHALSHRTQPSLGHIHRGEPPL